jgi:hypothetical protein
VIVPATTVPGVYYVIAHVDRDDAIEEFNEGNNIRSRKITIQ